MLQRPADGGSQKKKTKPGAREIPGAPHPSRSLHLFADQGHRGLMWRTLFAGVAGPFCGVFSLEPSRQDTSITEPENDNGRGYELSLIMWSFFSGGTQRASTRPEPDPTALTYIVGMCSTYVACFYS